MVENLKLEEKSKRDGKKFVKRQAPDKNYTHWDRQTFQRLIQAAPERLVSRIQVSHGRSRNLLSRPEDGCGPLRRPLREWHGGSPTRQRPFKRGRFGRGGWWARVGVIGRRLPWKARNLLR